MVSLAILRRCISGSRIFRSPCGSFRSLNSATSLNKSISRWGSRPRLMLPPAVESESEVVGCSHGWVAVFNKRNNNLFLSDPLSHEKIKLPPIHTLPDPEFNLDLDGQGSVSKVILSSSPDDDDCRAMMTFGPANRLAFCLPGRSSEWTPIGDHFFSDDHHYPFENIAMVHEDLVYCTRRKVFTSITAAHLNLRDKLYFRDIHPAWCPSERYDWDIQDPDSPKLVRSDELKLQHDGDDENVRSWLEENIEVLENECIQIPHLVYLDQLFVAMQFVRLMKEEGGSISPLGFVPRCEVKGLNGVFLGKTVGFIVMKMDDDIDRDGQVMGDLSGITIFLGINHSFAIEDHQRFNPNSIYFTDSKRIKRVCGVNDNGIFDYATKTISDYDDDDDPTQSFNFKASSPFWFV